MGQNEYTACAAGPPPASYCFAPPERRPEHQWPQRRGSVLRALSTAPGPQGDRRPRHTSRPCIRSFTDSSFGSFGSFGSLGSLGSFAALLWVPVFAALVHSVRLVSGALLSQSTRCFVFFLDFFTVIRQTLWLVRCSRHEPSHVLMRDFISNVCVVYVDVNGCDRPHQADVHRG